jgi:glycosyltransferase involved in cell wall biosynthesis
MCAALVSLVIPTYKPQFLGEAIESALAQTHPATEIVVSDQCPDDAVRQVVARYPNIRYQRNPVPGVYSNFRNCIRLARGEFVKFVLDDDLLAPHCVESMVKAFEEYDEVTLVSAWYHLIDAAGRERTLRRFEVDRPVVSSPGGGAGPMLVSARNPVGPLTTFMFRRGSFPQGIGPFFFVTGAPDRYFGLIDMTIILDLAFSGRVVTLPEPLSAMREHPDQLSNPAYNPRVVHSVKSWLPLADDAHAFGLISDRQHRDALDNILAQFERFVGRFPQLGEDITALGARLGRLQSD